MSKSQFAQKCEIVSFFPLPKTCMPQNADARSIDFQHIVTGNNFAFAPFVDDISIPSRDILPNIFERKHELEWEAKEKYIESENIARFTHTSFDLLN